jgi:hypothetical protein
MLTLTLAQMLTLAEDQRVVSFWLAKVMAASREVQEMRSEGRLERTMANPPPMATANQPPPSLRCLHSHSSFLYCVL